MVRHRQAARMRTHTRWHTRWHTHRLIIRQGCQYADIRQFETAKDILPGQALRDTMMSHAPSRSLVTTSSRRRSWLHTPRSLANLRRERNAQLLTACAVGEIIYLKENLKEVHQTTNTKPTKLFQWCDILSLTLNLQMFASRPQ